jgi:hypothetical protein
MNTSNSGVIETAKEKTVAGIKGVEKIVETTVDGAGRIITTTAKDTAKVGGEIGTAATGLVTGAVEGVKEIGVKTEKATADVASGAFKGVGEVGAAAVDSVRQTVTKPIVSDKAEVKVPDTASKN